MVAQRQFVAGDAFEWETRARCRTYDREIFFPVHGVTSPEPAKAVCRRCDVQAECLEYALGHGERFGVWGGTTARERRRLTRVPR